MKVWSTISCKYVFCFFLRKQYCILYIIDRSYESLPIAPKPRGINFYMTSWAPSDGSRVSDWRSLVCSYAADVNVDVLSEIMMWGHNLWLAKCCKAKKNVSIDRSMTISKCIALVSAHVNRHVYLLLLWRWRASIESTAVTIRTSLLCYAALLGPCSLCLGNGAVSTMFLAGSAVT